MRWASLQLRLMDARLQELADRPGAIQWPDGGWNCDRRPEARQSSLVETVLGLRGLAAWVRATATRPPNEHWVVVSSFCWSTTCCSTETKR